MPDLSRLRNKFSLANFGAAIFFSYLLGCAPSDPGTTHTSTEMQLSNIRNALMSFESDCHRFPTAAEGLLVLVTNSGIRGWKGPYLMTNAPAGLFLDAWGTPLRYLMKEGAPTVISAGPDRTFDTKDDLLQK